MTHTEASHRVVVHGIDFEESSAETAKWVIEHVAPHARHELVYVLEFPNSLRLLTLAADDVEIRLATHNRAYERLDEFRQQLKGVDIRIHVLHGKPATELVEFATELGADLIVVGEQGPRRGVGALLGSTAERVLMTSRIPVLVGRNVGAAPPSKLFVAIDNSPERAEVLKWAGELMHQTEASATVLNVVERTSLFDDLADLPSAGDLKQKEQRATVDMRDWLDAVVLDAGLAGPATRAIVTTGDPSYEIISRAAQAGADLILVGSGAASVSWTPLIGRTVNKVVRSASCSVLVVGVRQEDRRERKPVSRLSDLAAFYSGVGAPRASGTRRSATRFHAPE